VQYRAPGAGELRFARLDELTAVFHRASGQTHLVAAPVPELLAALADRELTADELLAGLLAEYDLADADREALVARLDELVEIGLVERT
jgi:PqqD family protein of HPr-rel-A system